MDSDEEGDVGAGGMVAPVLPRDWDGAGVGGGSEEESEEDVRAEPCRLDDEGEKVREGCAVMWA